MTTAAEFLEANRDARPEPEFNSRGQYVVPDPDKPGKRKAATRVTTMAKTIEDMFGLTRWEKRRVAVGMALRTDFCIAALAAGDDDKELDEVVEAAKEHAGGNAGRRHGTAMHAITERLDRGEQPKVSAFIQRDLDAYRSAMAPFVIEAIERLVYIPTLNVAGTVDRYVRLRTGGPLTILDLKTGRLDDDRVWVPWLIQTCLYARAKLWLALETQEWHDIGDVDQDHAYVLHLPQGEGKATLWRVDLSLGDELIYLCTEVRRVRNLKGIATEVTNLELALESSTPPRTQEGSTPAVDREPAPQPDDPQPSAVRGGLTLVPGERHWPISVDDNGVTANAANLRQLNALVRGASPTVRARLAVWERDATKAKRAFGGSQVTERQFRCARAALACAIHLADWQIVLGLAQVLSMGQADMEALPPDWLIGPCIGSLSIVQADALAHLALTAKDSGALDPF